MILPLTTVEDRLIIKMSSEDQSHQQGGRSDIFISHAHADSMWAAQVEEWLQQLWPDVTVERTNPSNDSEDYSDMLRFFRPIMRSRCLVLLATSRALARPVVSAELGAAKLESVVVLLADGTTVDDLQRLRLNDPFIQIRLDQAYDANQEAGWQGFADRIADILQIERIPGIQPGPPVCQSEHAITPGEALISFMHDMSYTMEKHVPGRAQTEAAAERLLGEGETYLAEKVAAEGDRLPFRLPLVYLSSRERLVGLAGMVSEERALRQFLASFPALIDEELLRIIEKTVNAEGQKRENANQALLSKLLLLRDQVATLCKRRTSITDHLRAWWVGHGWT